MGDRLAEIEALLDAATPGEWEAKRSKPHGFAYVSPVADMWSMPEEADNAELIAAAPRDLRDLVAVAKAARDVVQAHDRADDEMDWTSPAVDLLLRTALANLEGAAGLDDGEGGLTGEDLRAYVERDPGGGFRWRVEKPGPVRPLVVAKGWEKTHKEARSSAWRWGGGV